MTVHKQLLEAIKARSQKQTSWGHGILTADRYVRTLSECVGSEMCSRYAAAKDANFEDLLRKASETLVYSNEDMGLEKENQAQLEIKGEIPQANLIGVDFKASADQGLELPKNTLVVFRHTLTTPKKDRDGDILRTDGAVPDPKMLLLWQHVHTLPIGKMLSIVSHTEKSLELVSAIIDMNSLCHDAAVMVDNDMARFSHGFRALEFEMFKDSSGFDIKKFEIMEESLVSIPSNTDAETQEVLLGLVESGKLTSDMMKAAGAHIRENRPKQFTGVEINGQTGANPEAPQQCQCGKSTGTSAEKDGTAEGEVSEAEGAKDPEVIVTKYISSGDLTGSWENISIQLHRQAKEYLTRAGVDDMDECYVWVMGTYSDSVILCVEEYYGCGCRCYKCSYTLEAGKAVLTGEPQPVEINVEAVAATADAEMEERMSDRWKKRHKAGATLSKATKATLGEVRDDLIEIQDKESLSRGGKALAARSVGKLDSMLEESIEETSTQEINAKDAGSMFLAKATAEDRERVLSILEAMKRVDDQRKLARQVRSVLSRS